MCVVKGLEIFTLSFQLSVTIEPLATEEFAIVSVIKALDYSIAPGLGYRDENRLDSEMQTHPDNQTRRTRIAIAAAETQLIVKEQKIRKADSLPAAQQASGNLPILFGTLSLDINPVAVQVDHVE